MFALLRDTGYNVVLFLHVITVIVALTGAVAHPLMFALEQKRTDGDVVALAQRIEIPSRIYSISYVLVGLIGFGLVTMGDWPWGDAWIWISILLWIASLGLLHGALLPAERALAQGDTSAVSKLDRFGPIIAILLVVIVFLMTVKPGGSAL